MSGILALVDLRGDALDIESARPHLDAIAHRGDRQPVLWSGGPAVLGHVNLPTTAEAEHEALPATFDGRHWITWDGRLDNRDDLARRLGIQLRAGEVTTDAELVAAAYAQWGTDFVEHLLGDWAVVIWDAHERRLVCAKDPLGWRSLYWAKQGNRLMAGTEPRQFFAGGFLERRPNHDYLLRFLADALQQPNTTCYDGLSELLGGQVLTAHRGCVSVHTYWDRPRTRRLPRGARPEEYVEEFRALFAEAMRARLRTNRKVGVFLSGGLDSSYIAAIAAEQGTKPLAFTVFNPATRWMDERNYAAMVVDHLGLEQQLVDISDGWSLSSAVLGDETFDSPAQPPQAPAHVALARAAAANGVGVVFGGEGADEWLTGMPAIESEVRELRLISAWRMARTRRKGNASLLFARAAYSAYLPFALRNRIRELRGRQGCPVQPFVNTHRGWKHGLTYELAGGWSDGERLRRTWVLYRQHAGLTIGWRDRWAFGVNRNELRTPFNDLRLVEFLASVPESEKRFRGRRKDILREAEYAVLPRAIPDRDDFGLYSELLVDGARRESARREAALAALARVDGVDRRAVREEVDRWLADDHEGWEPNWRAITAGAWLGTFPAPASLYRQPGQRPGPASMKRKEVITQ
ncbi:MAG: 7-cyano-7-deazaguanine synthase [Dehalococcoidia bacterium]|nr:7-cyano-7-deazaguanine synthase [Dehalococcoidia bacterium]